MTRREMIKVAGMALIGIRQVPAGSKAVHLPPPGSPDPVAHSIAENLFWNDIMAHPNYDEWWQARTDCPRLKNVHAA